MPPSNLMTMPPADVAVAFLSRATAPMRRWSADRDPTARTLPSASRRPGEAGRSGIGGFAPDGCFASSPGAARGGRDRPGEEPSRERESPGKRLSDEGRVAARGPGSKGERSGPPVGLRTSRRCCAACRQSYPVRRVSQVMPGASPRPPVPGRHGIRPGRSHARRPRRRAARPRGHGGGARRDEPPTYRRRRASSGR